MRVVVPHMTKDVVRVVVRMCNCPRNPPQRMVMPHEEDDHDQYQYCSCRIRPHYLCLYWIDPRSSNWRNIETPFCSQFSDALFLSMHSIQYGETEALSLNRCLLEYVRCTIVLCACNTVARALWHTCTRPLEGRRLGAWRMVRITYTAASEQQLQQTYKSLAFVR